MNLESCFICNKPVIEIAGEYQLFDTYNLGEEDQHIVDNLNFGKCHAKCIAQSELNKFWYSKTLESKKTQHFEATPIDENSQLLFRSLDEQFVILNKDATNISFTLDQVIQAKESNEGLLISRGGETHVQMLDMRAGTLLCRTLKKKGQISLIEIFRELDIEDKILRPDLIEKGLLLYETDHRYRMYCQDGWVSGKSKYQLLVPTEAVLKIVEVTGV